MSIRLNEEAFKHAQDLIRHGEVEKTKLFKWKDNTPDRNDEARFLETHYDEEFGSWFLGINTDVAQDEVLQRYVYPIGDLQVVYKEGLVAAHKEAQKKGDEAIVKATQQLIDMIDSQEQ